MEHAEAKVKSLVKAMEVLECFSIKKPELGVTEIAQELHLQKSTVHNIMSTFETMGYLVQNRTTGKIFPGGAAAAVQLHHQQSNGVSEIFFSLHGGDCHPSQ